MQVTSEVLDFQYGNLKVIVYLDGSLDEAAAKERADLIRDHCESRKSLLESVLYNGAECAPYEVSTDYHVTADGCRYAVVCWPARDARHESVAAVLEMLALGGEDLQENSDVLSRDDLRVLGLDSYADFEVGGNELIV